MVDVSEIHVTNHALERFLQRGGTWRQTETRTKNKILNLVRHAKEVELTAGYKTLELERGARQGRLYFSTKFIFVLQNNAVITVMPMDFRKWQYKL